MDERTYLKVKIKSLAEEAKIIRLETKRAKRASIRDGLALHRKGAVRFEARHTHLVYGFLRGREYRQIEQKAHTSPDWDKVRRMIERYGAHWDYNSEDCNYSNFQLAKEVVLKRFDEWKEQARQEVTL